MLHLVHPGHDRGEDLGLEDGALLTKALVGEEGTVPTDKALCKGHSNLEFYSFVLCCDLMLFCKL